MRNLRRAGVLKNSSRTSTVVPMAARGRPQLAGAAVERQACAAPALRLVIDSSAMAAMAASASPRKPIVSTRSRSARVAILLVAWRRSASGSSSRGMPQPSSSTEISRTPPASSRTVDLAGAGVERVVDQFAHHRRRPLDHLAGGDLADQFVGQFADRPARSECESARSSTDCRSRTFGAARPRRAPDNPAPWNCLACWSTSSCTSTSTWPTSSRDYGAWVYALLFAIIFVETGVVVMPFLPGDSLLFVVGAMCGVGLMSYRCRWLVLAVAAILGDQCNYSIGR